MKSVCIFTFLRAYNYGAVLQAFALNKSINRLNAKAETVDYWPDYFAKKYHNRFFTHTKHESAKIKVKSRLLWIVLYKRNWKFGKFIKKNIPLSKKRFFCKSDLYKLDKYDVYMTGSDQVWSPTVAKFDPVFFLDSEYIDGEKYSYAASLGTSQVPTKMKNDYIKQLNQFSICSVRDNDDMTSLKEIIDKEIVVSCDPTLLLTQNEWLELLSNAGKNKKHKYILLYYVNQSNGLREQAKALSRALRLQVVAVPCNMSIKCILGKNDKSCGFSVVHSASPNDFLSLIYNAQYVVTNSFHGTVFSVLFHKKFLSQTIRDNGERNGRIISFLSSVGLEDRTLDYGIKKLNQDVDWESVDNTIDSLRCLSINYLKSIIE